MKLVATLALLLAMTATAAAGPGRKSAPRKAEKAQPAATTRPVKSYDFLGDKIDGDRILPDGSTVFGLPDAERSSLIRLRGDFVKEITRTAEML